MATILTTAQVAEKLDTDARTLRKFLRDDRGEGKAVVGKGKRYQIDAKEVSGLSKKFAAWTEARAAKVAEAVDEVAETE